MKTSPTRRIRIFSQAVFLLLFLALVVLAQDRWIGRHVVSFFLYTDPLVGLGSALASGRLALPLLLGAGVLAATVVFGRFYCGWVCPFGTLHQLVGWLARRRRKRAAPGENGWRPVYGLKYAILAAFLVMAPFGILQVGLLDPIVMMKRAGATLLVPAADDLLTAVGLPPLSVRPRFFHAAWLSGAIFLGFLAANVWIPRFFCRAICPLGALYGLFARFSLFRIVRDGDSCTACGLCERACEGAADPFADVRKAECYVCWKCIDACGQGSLRYAFHPSDAGAIPGPDPGRRRLLGGIATGLLAVPLVRATGISRNRPRPDRIRPPGSRPEPEFLARCVKCDACVRVCPTNVVQPALAEAGIEGLWTPVLDMRAGYCELNCTLCGQVCPTEAIRPIDLDEKLGRGEFDGSPIRLGTAFVDRSRCLPWAMETACVVCEEVCPVSPKAIFTRAAEVTGRDGVVRTLDQPHVDPALCIGCGICQHSCPIQDRAAIRVTAVGESRAGNAGGFLLDRGG